MAALTQYPTSIPETFPGSKHLNGDSNGVLVTNTEVQSPSNHEAANGSSSSTYEIKEQWHSQPRHLRVIHVGAGAAGLLMAYKMKKGFEDYSLVCYEKYVLCMASYHSISSSLTPTEIQYFWGND
jgi:hypothetical protein